MSDNTTSNAHYASKMTAAKRVALEEGWGQTPASSMFEVMVGPANRFCPPQRCPNRFVFARNASQRPLQPMVPAFSNAGKTLLQHPQRLH